MEETKTVAPIMSDEMMDRMWKFAERISASKFLPCNMRGDVPSIFHAITTGQDMGITWTHAARSLFPSQDGGTGTKGDVILSLLTRAGFDVQFDFTAEPVIGCTCTITRPGGKPVSRTFTMADATKIQTRWIPTEEGGKWETLAENWFYHQFPKEMCQWRSLAHCGRVAASDLVAGLYLAEELTPVPQQQRNGKPAVEPEAATEEFVVGEKPESPETNETIAETTAPVVETVPAQTGAKTTSVERTFDLHPVGSVLDFVGSRSAAADPVVESAPAQVEAEITPREKPPVTYEIWQWNPNGLIPTVDTPQLDLTVAKLSAISFANKTGVEHRVLRNEGGTLTEVEVCKPPERPLVTSAYELYQIMSDGSTARVGDQEFLSSDACSKAARERMKQVRSTHVIVLRGTDGSRKEFGRIEPTVDISPETGFNGLVNRIRTAIGGDEKAAGKLMTRYYVAFLGEKTKDHGRITPALVKLVEVIDQRVGELRADPEGLGRELGGRKLDPLTEVAESLGWDAATIALASQVQTITKQDTPTFVEWLKEPMEGDVSIAKLKGETLTNFLRLFLLAKGRSWEVVEWANSHDRTPKQALDALIIASEKPIAAWDEAFALEALDTIQKVAPKKADTAPKPASPEEDDSDNWDTAGLPFGK